MAPEPRAVSSYSLMRLTRHDTEPASRLLMCSLSSSAQTPAGHEAKVGLCWGCRAGQVSVGGFKGSDSGPGVSLWEEERRSCVPRVQAEGAAGAGLRSPRAGSSWPWP